MSERQKKLLQMLIEEFSRDGYECFEFKGKSYARLTLNGVEVEMTDVCLSRLAETIEKGLERKQL